MITTLSRQVACMLACCVSLGLSGDLAPLCRVTVGARCGGSMHCDGLRSRWRFATAPRSPESQGRCITRCAGARTMRWHIHARSQWNAVSQGTSRRRCYFLNGAPASVWAIGRARFRVRLQVTRIFTQLLMAVDHIHRHKVLHRDIKPANVFLAQPDNTEMLVFLGDFGVCHFCSVNDHVSTAEHPQRLARRAQEEPLK